MQKKESLRADLDVKGLREQVLRRIAELERREREALLAEVTAMAEEQGHDTGAVKAVLGD